MATTTESIGRVLARRYRIESALGSGTSATVYAAWDVVLQRRVAVKVLHPGLADDGAFLRGVIAEVVRGRDDYHALAARHGLRSLPSSTNFVCLEIGTRAEAEAMVTALLEAGVFVRKPWAPPIDGFIRVTVGTAAEREAFAERFVEALDRAREKAPT